MTLSAGEAARRKPRRVRLRARTAPPVPLRKARRETVGMTSPLLSRSAGRRRDALHLQAHRPVDGDGLPAEGAEAEMAVAAGQVQPLDHAGLDAGRVLPAAELERLEPVVDYYLAGAHRRRELGPDAEVTHVVVGAHLVALADAAASGVVHVHEHERAALVRLLHDAVDDVGGVDAPAVVAAGED